MTKQKYLEEVLMYPENAERIKTISDLYEKDISGVILKIISFADKVDFIDVERRALSYNEIINASKEYNKGFKELGIIPFIDAYDNDLIVYIISENQWAKYNLSDDILFKKKDNLEDVL